MIMGSLYTLIPSFVGLFFTYLIIYFEEEKKKLYIYLSFIYLIFYELDKGFYLFSYALTFMVVYNFFVERIRSFFSCNNCILTVYILFAYIGHYFVNALIAYILNQDVTPLVNDYIYYIFIDMVLAAVIFKGKV